MVKEAIRKADVLIEALPYIKKFHNRIFVIKYGGSILKEETVRKAVLEDIAFLRYIGVLPILVHGGGPSITERLKNLKTPVEFVNGIRVTDAFTLNIVEEELDKLNDIIVGEINAHGALAQSVKKDERVFRVVKKKSPVNLGFVGEITGCDVPKLKEMMKTSIPVLTPLGISEKGETYNINADDAACFLAGALKAEKVVLLTKVMGVMRDPQDDNSLMSTITLNEAEKLIKNKTIVDGMVPKVKSALKAVELGVGKAHIVDAKIPHAILLEIFTDTGIGTEIIN